MSSSSSICEFFSFNLLLIIIIKVFEKSNRARLSRKELFKSTLRKCAHAFKRIIELRLTGISIYISL